MKAIIKNPLLVLFMFLLCMHMEGYIRPLCICICCLYWYQHHSLKSSLTIFVILLLTYTHGIPFVYQDTYRVVDVKSSYAIVENNKDRIVVYCSEPLLLDANVEIKSTPHPFIEESKFFGFSQSTWAKQNHFSGYTYQSEIKVVHINRTLRYLLQQKINQIEDTISHEIIQQILLNIHNKTIDITDIYEQSGFSYISAIWVLMYLIKYYLTENKRHILQFVLLLFFSYLYHYPIILLYACINTVLSFFHLSFRLRIMMASIILLLIRPEAVYSLSFQIPFLYRLKCIFTKKSQNLAMFSLIAIVCSRQYQFIQILSLCMYGVFRYFMGITWLLAIFWLYTGVSTLAVIQLISKPMIFLRQFTIFGSISLFSIFLIYLICRNCKYQKYIFIFLCVLGFCFHPFSTVTLLKSKGTSLLLTNGLSKDAVLVQCDQNPNIRDIESYLHALSISKVMVLGDIDETEFNQIEIVSQSQQEKIQSKIPVYQLNLQNSKHPIWMFTFEGMNFLLLTYLDESDITYLINRYQDLDIDIMLLANHGSSKMNPERLIDFVQPKVCISNNDLYESSHMPSRQVIQFMQQRHILWLDTADVGDMRFFCIFRKHFILTSTGKLVIMD